MDTLRYDFLVRNLITRGRPVLLVGPVGTGKTSVAQGVLQKLDPTEYNLLTINLSAQVKRVREPLKSGLVCSCNYCVLIFGLQTSSNNVQEIIEGKVEKRTKGTYVHKCTDDSVRNHTPMVLGHPDSFENPSSFKSYNLLEVLRWL